MLNKEKYKEKLEDMLPSIIAVSKSGEVGRCMNTVYCGNCIFYGGDCDDLARDWLNSECKEPILTKEEKEYLQAFIKTFRDEIESIGKYGNNTGMEYLMVFLKGEEYFPECYKMPYFLENTAFKNMKGGKKYTLEELGL